MKRFVSFAISITILLIIYAKIDFPGLSQVFQPCTPNTVGVCSNPMWMAISLGMVVPITLFTAWRLQQLMPNKSSLGFIEANRLILGASVLNMVLPSKMGDIAKAYFMRDRGHLSGSLSLSLVIFEKASDMLSLLLWCVFGLIIYPAKNNLFWAMTGAVTGGLLLGFMLLGYAPFAQSLFHLISRIAPQKQRQKFQQLQTDWREMHNYFWQDKQQLIKIALTSILIWFLHLLQIWLFILALNAWTPFVINLALSPLAILAGLLPLTFAGIGTRDAALIFFYQDYFSPNTGAALGLLCTSRYFLPALIGLPFLGQMLSAVRNLKG